MGSGDVWHLSHAKHGTGFRTSPFVFSGEAQFRNLSESSFDKLLVGNMKFFGNYSALHM